MIHYFETTGDAYDATQCRDDIKTGDMLVIKSESVIGLAWTWPIAVTKDAGKLHTVAHAETDANITESCDVLIASAGITPEQARKAVAVAVSRRLLIHPAFDHLVA